MTPAELRRLAAIRADLASGRAREAREAANVTVAEMAAAISDAIPVTPQAVSLWELNRRRPGAARALAYARTLAALARRAA
jgi:transcriptional regulator with XRE-family HTH domain